MQKQAIILAFLLRDFTTTAFVLPSPSHFPRNVQNFKTRPCRLRATNEEVEFDKFLEENELKRAVNAFRSVSFVGICDGRSAVCTVAEHALNSRQFIALFFS